MSKTTGKDTVIQQSEDGTVHSYSQEEKQAIVEFINTILKDDPDLAKRIPINTENDDIFEQVKDGLVFGKLVNAIIPGTIPKNKLTVKPNPTRFEVLQNQDAVLKGARQIGVQVINMGPDDLASGKVHLVLGLLWQLVRMHLLQQVGMIGSRITFLRKSEEEEPLPEEILVRWVNYHLEKHPNFTRRVSNFSTDIKDSECYTVLLYQLAPHLCTLDALKEKDKYKRAQFVLENADKVKCRKFVNANDIVKGDKRLNTAFVATLFTAFNFMPDESELKPKEEVPIPAAVVAATEDIVMMEREILELQELLKRAEEAEHENDKVTQSLAENAEHLRKQLEENRRTVYTKEKAQEEEINKLKDKLRKLQVDNASSESTQQLQERIKHEEQEKQRIVENARKRELELEDLRDELADRTDERMQLERKRKQLEVETQKMRQFQKMQLERLKQRVFKAKETEAELESELDAQIKVTNKEEDLLWQKQREEHLLDNNVQMVKLDKDRIRAMRNKIQEELHKATIVVEDIKVQQEDQERQKVKLQVRMTAIKLETQELELQKRDAEIQNRILAETVEDVKNDLVAEETARIHLRGFNERLQQKLEDIDEDLQNAEEDKLTEAKRLKKQLDYTLAKAERDAATEKRKLMNPLAQLEDEIKETTSKLIEEGDKQAKAKQKHDMLAAETAALTDIANEEQQKIRQLKEGAMHTERELNKLSVEAEDEKKARRAQESAAAKMSLEARRAATRARNEAEKLKELEDETQSLSSKKDQLRAQKDEELKRAKALEDETHNLENKLKTSAQALEDEKEARDRKLADAARKQKAETDSILKDLEKSKVKLDAEKRAKEERISQLADKMDDEKRAKAKLDALKDKKEAETKMLEKRIEGELNEKSETERKKKKLEEDLLKAASIVESTEKATKAARDRTKKLETSVKSAASTQAELEKKKTDLADKSRSAELKLDTKDRIRLGSTSEKSRKELELDIEKLTAGLSLATEEAKRKTSESSKLRREKKEEVPAAVLSK